MTSIQILIVGSGPVSNSLTPSMQYDDLRHMKRDFKKRGCPSLFDYCIENDVLFDITGCQEFCMEDIPKRYWTYFMKEIISHGDLDNHRKLIAQKIKQLYPSIKKITYTTVDMYTVSPEFCGSMKYALATDKNLSKRYGVKFIYNKHYKMKFQEYIATHLDSKFDIVWFLGCCNPHYLVNRKKSYISNFRNILIPNGYIMHTDPTPEGFGFINIDTRFNHLSETMSSESEDDYDIDLSKINYLLRHLDNIEEGVYKFFSF